jgi:hypothetical protein
LALQGIVKIIILREGRAKYDFQIENRFLEKVFLTPVYFDIPYILFASYLHFFIISHLFTLVHNVLDPDLHGSASFCPMDPDPNSDPDPVTKISANINFDHLIFFTRKFSFLYVFSSPSLYAYNNIPMLKFSLGAEGSPFQFK